jgi:hypothetical protein
MEHKKGDVFWMRRKSAIGGAPKNFMRIIQLDGNPRLTNLAQYDSEYLYNIVHLRHYSNNPHRVKKVASEHDLDSFWIKMSDDEAYLAKLLFQVLDFKEYEETSRIRAGQFLKKIGVI